MSRTPLVRIAAGAAAAIGLTVAAGTPALAAGGDTTPPTAPFLTYAQGYYCGVLIVGMNRSTDNVTPQSQLKYEVFVDGKPLRAGRRPRQRVGRVGLVPGCAGACPVAGAAHGHRQGAGRRRQLVRAQQRGSCHRVPVLAH
jgi:hypothetical protein